MYIYIYIYIYDIHWWLQWRQVGALSPTSSECKFRPFSTVASIDERNHTGFVRVALQRYIVKLKSSEQLEMKYIYICIYYINFIKWHIYIYIYIYIYICASRSYKTRPPFAQGPVSANPILRPALNHPKRILKQRANYLKATRCVYLKNSPCKY